MNNFGSWSPAAPAENPQLSLDMSDAVTKQGGSPISSATAAVTVAAGVDPLVANVFIPVCNVSGNVVSIQKAANTGVNGTTYLVTFTAITAAGKVIVGSMNLPIQAGGA